MGAKKKLATGAAALATVVVMALSGVLGGGSATTDPFPRLVLRGDNLTAAASHATAAGSVTAALYQDMIDAPAPIGPQQAVDKAFVHRIEHALYGSAANNNHGWQAFNYAYDYVTNPANDPATVWASYGSIKSYAGERIIPIALVLDWVADTDIGTTTKRTAMREYLCEWVNLIDAQLGTLTSADMHNYYVQNIAADGLALMEIGGSESKGSCTLALYGGASAETRIGQLITATTDLYFAQRLRNGTIHEEGIHYQDLSLPEMTVFLAAADAAGYIAANTTAAVNTFEGLAARAVPATGFMQWGDAIESTAMSYKRLWGQYTYLMQLAGQRPGDYYVWDTIRGTDYAESWATSGHRPFIVMFYDPTVVAATPTAPALFIRDNLTQTPEPIGGFVMLRSDWSTTALVARLTNRGDHAEHSHFDAGGLELHLSGQQFVLDHSGSYNEEAHGEAGQHSTVVFYDSGASQWGNLPSNDYTSTTADDSSAFGQIVAFADRPNVGSAVYADLRYGLVNQLDASRVFLPKATITPAPVGRRLLLFNRQAGQPPLLAVFDRTGLGAAKDWRTQWHLGSDLTITGSGTTAAPLVVSHANGATLYAFVSDGRSIVAGPDRVYDTSNCNNCEAPDTRNYVYYTQQSATSEPVLSTIWLASPGGAPTLTLEVLSSRNTYKIERPGASGYTRYVQNQGRTSITIGRVTTDAEAFLLNYDAGGNIIGGVFANYTALQDNGVTLDGLTNARVAAIEFAGSDGSARHGYASNSALATVTVGAPLTEATITPTATATRTATPTPTPSRTPTPVYAAGVRFNEVSPSELYDWSLSGTVSAADRYFELINWAATTANISGCTIGNGTDTYAFPTGTTLTAYARKVFLAEDTVHIPDNGTLTLAGTGCSASVVYTAAPDTGQCYSASPDGSGSFAWVAPENCTPGQPNP